MGKNNQNTSPGRTGHTFFDLSGAARICCDRKSVYFSYVLIQKIPVDSVVETCIEPNKFYEVTSEHDLEPSSL